MKWLSTKTHRPPSCTNVFIRAVLFNDKGQDVYDRFFVAMIEDYTHIYLLESWEMANNQKILDIDQSDYIVTHFIIPDALELED